MSIGPEQIILPGGLQPFMFQSDKGTLVLQAQLPFPKDYVQPEKNAYPGYPGTVRSVDGGRTWQVWQPAPDQGAGPIIEGSVANLRDGTSCRSSGSPRGRARGLLHRQGLGVFRRVEHAQRSFPGIHPPSSSEDGIR